MAARWQDGGGAMDQAIFHLINERWTHPALDLFMAAISDVQIWKPVFVLLVLYALIFRGFKGRAFICCVALTLALCETLAVRPLKSTIGRLRPKQVQSVRLIELQKARPKFLTIFKQPRIHRSTPRGEETTGGSFPSGHVTNNTVIGICCALFFRRWGWLYGFITAAVAWSRIYLGAHWPSDVLATVFMAAGLTLLALALFELIWQRAAARWQPLLFALHPSLLETAVPVSHLRGAPEGGGNLPHR